MKPMKPAWRWHHPSWTHWKKIQFAFAVKPSLLFLEDLIIVETVVWSFVPLVPVAGPADAFPRPTIVQTKSQMQSFVWHVIG